MADEIEATLGDGEPARRKGKLHGATVSKLRELIVSGYFAPGTRLNERQLCEQFQVSRTPVREAIKTLTQDGLLRVLPNHSAVVTELDPAEISALNDVVSVMEALAGELSAQSITDEAIAELEQLQAEMQQHQARSDMPAYFAANKRFHRLLVTLSGNPVLLWVWDLLALRVDRARYSSNLEPQRWREAIAEHGRILDALKARDPAAASQALRSHVRNGLVGLVARLEEET